MPSDLSAFDETELISQWIQLTSKLENAPDGNEALRLAQSLRLHQIKLELQNRELREAQQRRRESEERFHAIFDSVNDAIFVHDAATGAIVDVNRRACELYGYSREELLQLDVEALSAGVPPYTQQDALEWLAMAARGEPQTFEWWARNKSGGLFWVEVTMRCAMVAAEERLLVSMRDITKRKKLQTELERSEERYRIVADFTYDWESWRTPDDVLRYVSPSCEGLTGYRPEEFIGDPTLMARIVHPDDVATYIHHMHDYMPHDEAAIDALGIDFRIIRRDGEVRWVSHVCRPVYGRDGEYLGRRASNRDITERKAAETKLHESHDKLQLMARYLETVREEEQKRIARELHDEMGGVLAALNMNVARLEAKLPAEMTHLSTEAGAMAKLVAAAIQAMRRAVAQLRPAILDDAGLAAAIESYVREFQENTEIECRLTNGLPEEEPMLGRDRSATVFRIVQESLTNVAKHAQARKVTITLKELRGSLVLTVKDNGKGFDPNVRNGESFGLQGIRERALLVGGRIRIRSAAGKGTTVRMSVPMNPAPAPQQAH